MPLLLVLVRQLPFHSSLLILLAAVAGTPWDRRRPSRKLPLVLFVSQTKDSKKYSNGSSVRALEEREVEGGYSKEVD